MTGKIEQSKILDYILNNEHNIGRHKSKYFQSFGFTREEWKIFKQALIDHKQTARLADQDTESSHGEKRVYECNLTTPGGRNPCIRTVWMATETEGEWRFLTAYPARR